MSWNNELARMGNDHKSLPDNKDEYSGTTTVKLNETPFGALDNAHPREQFAELAT